MSRLIDADALIETIENVCCKPCKELKHDYNGVRCRACQYGDEIDDIDSFHTAEQPHWIPCSEKLPEDGVYLVTYESGYSESGVCDIEDVCCYDEDEGWEETHVIPNKKILAWTNLPEPYKESEEC